MNLLLVSLISLSFIIFIAILFIIYKRIRKNRIMKLKADEISKHIELKERMFFDKVDLIKNKLNSSQSNISI